MEHCTPIAEQISVLIVEDEAIISEWVMDSLIDDGFEVHAVGTARDALNFLGAGAHVDVLFTDINLPGGIDGVMLARLACALHPDLKVVYASGRVRGLNPDTRVPGSAFVAKPYMPSQVASLLTQMTHAH